MALQSNSAHLLDAAYASQQAQMASKLDYRQGLRQQMAQSEKLNEWYGCYTEALKGPEPLRSVRTALTEARVEEKRLLAARAALDASNV